MCDDAKTIEVCLECLFIILSVGDKVKGSEKNPLVVELFSLNAVDILEKLQYHESDAVYTNVSKLLTTYFEIQDPLDLWSRFQLCLFLSFIQMNYFFAKFIDKLHFTIKEKAKKIKSIESKKKNF